MIRRLDKAVKNSVEQSETVENNTYEHKFEMFIKQFKHIKQNDSLFLENLNNTTITYEQIINENIWN